MLKTAVVGAGNWGRNLIRTLDQLGVLAAVVEKDPAKRVELVKSYKNLKIYADLPELLNDPGIQAVFIATPVPTHYQLARAALLAGKDVFLEKPLVLSTAEAKKLVELAGARERVLMAGHLLLYQPAVQWLKQYILSGAAGELRILSQERLKLGRVRSNEDVLWSFGVHDVAVLLFLVGRPPELIEAVGQCVLQPQIADDVYVHLAFKGGVKAHLHVSWLWPEQRRSLTVVCSEAMLVYDELEQTVTLHRKGISAGLTARDLGSEVVFRGSAEPLRLECEHFLRAVKERKTPLSDGKSAVEVIRVLEGASEKLRRSLTGQADLL